MAQDDLTKYQLIKELIALNEYPKAFKLLKEIIGEDNRSENMVIGFQSRYNRLENDIFKGILSRDDSEIDFNRLNNNITSFMDSHQKKAAFMATVPRIAGNPAAATSDQVINNIVNNYYGDHVEGDKTSNTYGDNANVGNSYSGNAMVGNTFGNNAHVGDDIDADNVIKGDHGTINITNTRNEFQESIPQIEALVEEEQKHGFITQEEYEELMDILADIQENAEPKNERQEKKWKRWLGKALSAGEKMTSTAVNAAVGAGVKTWVSDGGLQVLGKFIGIL